MIFQGELHEKIRAFSKAQGQLDEAEADLSAVLGPILEETSDISTLATLAALLPLGYMPAPFVHEKMAKLTKGD